MPFTPPMTGSLWTEEEPDFPPVSDVADLGKNEGEIARNIAVNIRLFEGWDE